MKKNRLTILCCAAIGLLILGGLLLHFGRQDVPSPTLTAEQIVALPDLELMRRVRLDLLARQLAGPAPAPPPAGRLPVAVTIAFEDALYAIGQTDACAHAGGAEAVAAGYVALGAPAVGASVKSPDAVTAALATAEMEKLRAAWVRQHASDFVGQ